MKIIAAMDSFKGSLTSMEAGNAVREGILRAVPDARVVVKPVADGGEGTVEAMAFALGGELITCRVKGPIGKKVTASYCICREKGLAVIEVAQAAGLTLVTERNPWKATSYGVGELIMDAAEKGCRIFYVGLGGSATNDCGIGMLDALGIHFYDGDGKRLKAILTNLGKIERISLEDTNGVLEECTFTTACDVINPLCGKNGATYVFGPQKGIMPHERESIDRDFHHFADICASFLDKDMRDEPGAGAAGGLGYAFYSFFHTRSISGIQMVLQATELEKEMKDADLVVTGEGQLDEQTMMGKVPAGIAALAKRNNCMVIALAGSVKAGACCNKNGIDACFSIQKGAVSLQEAMQKENAYNNLKDTSEQIFRLIAGKESRHVT